MMQHERHKQLFAAYQIPVDDATLDRLAQFADLITNESARQNLTAVKEPEEIWTRHFLDAAYLLRYLPQNTKIIDIGTGGGIPGIPIAICRPDLRVTLLDSELHKIEFCKEASKKLDLQLECICARAEELAKDAAYRGQFDVAVSRAMAAGSMLSELSVPFLKIGGKLIAMKGRSYDADAERFASAAAELGCEEPITQDYLLEGEQKYLITLHKITETDAKYPRRFAKIKRAPL